MEGNKKNMLAITIQMQGKPIVVKVDTGAKVTAISDAKQNTYGAKKGEANQKQQLSDYNCN